jgi:heterotetrameric sarcosine oxidase gamma subunit
VSDTSGVNVRPRNGLGTMSIATSRGGAAALAQALRDHAGLAPPEPGCWVGDDALALLWCAPGQFLAVGDAVVVQRFADALRGAALLIDLTGARAVVRLSGPSVRDVLARVVPLDLHPRVMAPGRVAATVAAHIGVHIWQVDDAPSYDIAGPVSSAGSLLRALELAGASAASA